MSLEIVRRRIGGIWRTVEVDANGGSLPANVDWDENGLVVHEAADSGPLTPDLFTLKTLLASGLRLSVKVTAFFTSSLTTYNDNGDELFESDPLANGGDGEVRINGAAFSASGYQQTSEKGQADGYASLDSGGLVPTAQLPETQAVVPDDPFFQSAGGPPVLTQGNVTATLGQYDVFWQRIGRVVFIRLFVLVDTATGELGEPWFIDLPAGVPSAEYQLGSSAPIAIGSGAFNRDGAWEAVSCQINQDPGGAGPTRRLQLVGPGAIVGTSGAGDQLIGGETIQAFLTYEAALSASVPLNLTAPIVTGTAQDGETLTTDDGTWPGAPSFSYTWEVSDDGDTGWTPVIGETTNTLVIVTGQVGKFLRAVVTATNPGPWSTSAPSNVVGPVIAA